MVACCEKEPDVHCFCRRLCSQLANERAGNETDGAFDRGLERIR